jgi:acetate kinase
MPKTMLALNAGSSSIKFGLFGMAGAAPACLFAGEVADIGDKPHLTVKDMHGKLVLDRNWPAPRKQEDILDDILGWTDQNTGSGGLAAIGHRIVHGGFAICGAGTVDSRDHRRTGAPDPDGAVASGSMPGAGTNAAVTSP